MDDILWWGRDQGAVKGVLAELKVWLTEKRRLALKPDVQVNRSACGVTYCGHRVLRGAMRLTPRRKRRYGALARGGEQAWLSGTIDDAGLQRRFDAVHAITLHADSREWRRRHWALRPSRYSDDEV